jgi:hypothetical protein
VSESTVEESDEEEEAEYDDDNSNDENEIYNEHCDDESATQNDQDEEKDALPIDVTSSAHLSNKTLRSSNESDMMVALNHSDRVDGRINAFALTRPSETNCILKDTFAFAPEESTDNNSTKTNCEDVLEVENMADDIEEGSDALSQGSVSEKVGIVDECDDDAEYEEVDKEDDMSDQSAGDHEKDDDESQEVHIIAPLFEAVNACEPEPAGIKPLFIQESLTPIVTSSHFKPRLVCSVFSVEI